MIMEQKLEEKEFQAMKKMEALVEAATNKICEGIKKELEETYKRIDELEQAILNLAETVKEISELYKDKDQYKYIDDAEKEFAAMDAPAPSMVHLE